MSRLWRAVRRCVEAPNLYVAVPGRGEPFFPGHPGYGRFVGGLLAVQLVGFGLWQVQPLAPFLRAHSQSSWQNVVAEGRWWAAFTAQVCHRDPEHLATNLATLVVPVYMLQGLLPWWGGLGLCTVAAAASSSAGLAIIFLAFAPAEARRHGLAPWAPPRYAALVPTLRCPEGHVLSLCSPGRDTPSESHVCDACGRKVLAYGLMHRCMECDYDLCLGCAGADQLPGLRLHHFRNEFDEFCYLREAELVVGFDTMLSETPFPTFPDILQHAPRLQPHEASGKCGPYMEWWHQSSRGSLGSSGLAAAVSSACALWLGELAWRGWRHPLLLFFPVAASVQPLVDLRDALQVLRVCQQAHAQGELPDPGPLARELDTRADFAGHLAGNVAGVLVYWALLRRRAGGPRPLYPLVPTTG